MLGRDVKRLRFAAWMSATAVGGKRFVKIFGVRQIPKADLVREKWAELIPPKSDRLMRDVDSPLMEQVFHILQRQREQNIHHHREADDFRWGYEMSERITH